VLVTAPSQDIGVGELMAQELEQALRIPVQLVPLDQLGKTLDQAQSSTVVTSRYFIGEAEAIARPKAARVIPVDIYDYAKEIQLVKNLPKDTCFGIVSLASGRSDHPQLAGRQLAGDDGPNQRCLQSQCDCPRCPHRGLRSGQLRCRENRNRSRQRGSNSPTSSYFLRKLYRHCLD
jgi:hypothetical protein